MSEFKIYHPKDVGKSYADHYTIEPNANEFFNNQYIESVKFIVIY